MESRKFLVLVLLFALGVLSVSAQSLQCVTEFATCLPQHGASMEKPNRDGVCKLENALKECSTIMSSEECRRMANLAVTGFSIMDKRLHCSNTSIVVPDCSAGTSQCGLKAFQASGVDMKNPNLKDLKDPFCRFRDGFQSCQNGLKAPCNKDLVMLGFSDMLDLVNDKEYKCGCSGLVASLTLVLTAMFFILQRK